MNIHPSVITHDTVIESEQRLKELEEILNSKTISNDEKQKAINEFIEMNGGKRANTKEIGFSNCVKDGFSIFLKQLGLGENITQAAKSTGAAGVKAIKFLPSLFLHLFLLPFAQATSLRLMGEGSPDYSGYKNFFGTIRDAWAHGKGEWVPLACIYSICGWFFPFAATIVCLMAAIAGGFNPITSTVFIIYWLSQLTSLFYEIGRYKKLHAGDK